jgi:hypothetical protein
MLKNILTSIILLLFTSSVFGQHITDSLLLGLEKQVFETPCDTIKTELILQKASLYFQANRFDSLVINETDRIDWRLLKNKSDCSRFLWNASLANLLQKRYTKAEFYFNHYVTLNKNETDSSQLNVLAALIFMPLNHSKLIELIGQTNDSLIQALTCYQSVLDYQKTRKNYFVLASALIPGSGMLSANKPKQGFTSLALNTATVYFIYILAQHNLYANAITWGFILGQKFYLGNLALTQKLVEEAEAKQRQVLAKACENTVFQLLKKHSLSYKK